VILSAHAFAFENTPLKAAVFWASYAAWFAMELWIGLRDRRAVHGLGADRGTRWVVWAAIYVAMFLGFGLRFALPAADIPAPALLLDLSGAALVWLGMALRLCAVLTLGRFFRTSVFVHDDHQLVGHGPYRFLRNPGYTGSLITFAGLGLTLGNWASLAVVLAVMIAAYGLRIHAEEQALGDRFGDAYAVYRKGRWALIPPIW
jgi:protein-S-isoprenylcysteine O-methyltransferase Ste14